MSNKQAKKRKPSLFDPDEIKARLAAQTNYVREVRGKICALNDVDLGRLMADSCALTEDEALRLLASKISITGLYNLRTALAHVPGNITRVLNKIPLRSTLILKIFKSMASPGSENMTIDDLSLYIKFAETYCSSFLKVKESDDHLWKLTESEELVFNKFFTPPVSQCLQCDKKLSVRGNPSKAILFTLDGPVPCTKVTLECWECSHVYGVCNHRNESGSRFYPKHFNIELVEVSNLTYFHLKLYKWFPSLRLVNYICAFIIIYLYYIFLKNIDEISIFLY